MATISLKNNPVNTFADLPQVGSVAPEFILSKIDLTPAKLSDYRGKRIILNIFPSVDTGICAMSVRQFNQQASQLTNTVVLCISKDLPFAQQRFCGAENLEQVEMLSSFKDNSFGKNYGVLLIDGPLEGLLTRAIVVLDENAKVLYTELVAEISTEPNYQQALAAAKA